MDESMEIKNRRYQDIVNHITNSLQPYVVNQEMKLKMVRTGVTIDDQYEMITLVCNNRTYVSFVVDKSDDMVVNKVSIDRMTFQPPFNIFHLKDKKAITDYLNSFTNLSLDLYSQEQEVYDV